MYNEIINAKLARVNGCIENVEFTSTFKSYLNKLNQGFNFVDAVNREGLITKQGSLTIRELMKISLFTEIEFGQPVTLGSNQTTLTIEFIREKAFELQFELECGV
jgi:hypothetical protein